MCRRAHNRIVALSLVVSVGVCTLGAERVSVASRSVVDSTLGAGAYVSVTDQFIRVVLYPL